MAIELAVAYVNLVPSFNHSGGGAKGLENEIAGQAEKAAKAAGGKAGKALQDSLGASLKGTGDKVAASLAPAAAAATTAGATAGRSFGTGLAASSVAGARSAGAQVRSSFEQAVLPGVRAIGERAASEFSTRFKAGVSRAGTLLDPQKLTGFGSSAATAGTQMSAAFTVPLAAIGVGSFKAASDFESAFAGVEKTVDGTAAQFDVLRQGIIDMATEIPSTREEIAGVAAVAGQLGIETPNVLSFTRTMIDLGNSTDIVADQAAVMLAQFANITGMNQADFGRLGSSIVELGNNFATTESRIVDMSQRIASAGSQIGLTEPEILGFATTLSSLGIDAEAGGTAVSKVMIDVAKAVDTGGEKLDTFAKIAGQSAAEFSASFRDDPAAAIEKFIAGLDNAEAAGTTMFQVLDDLSLGDVRVGNALRSMAGSGDLLKRAIDSASGAWDENNALVEEAAKRYGTTESQMKIFTNNVTELAMEFGNTLAPMLTSAIHGIEGLKEPVQGAVAAFGSLPGPVQAGVVGIGGLIAVAGPATAAVGFMAQGIGSAVSAVQGLSGKLRNAEGGLSTLGKTGAGLVGALGAAGAAFAVYQLATALNDATRDALAFDTALQRIKATVAGGAPVTPADFASLAAAKQGAGDRALDLIAPFKDTGQTASFSLGDEVIQIDNATRALEGMRKSDPEALAASLELLGSAKFDAGSNLFDQQRWDAFQKQLKDYRENLDATAAAEAAASGSGSRTWPVFESIAAAIKPLPKGEQAAQDFATSMANLEQNAQLAAVGVDAAGVAASSFSKAVDGATSTDNNLSAGLRAGRALKDLRVGLGLQAAESTKAGAANDEASKAVDRLTSAASAADPAMSALGINMAAASAAADGFTKSIDQSSSLDDLTGSAFALGTAARGMRSEFRRLPADIDLTAAALGQYKPRQAEAVQGLLQLGSAARSYLAELVKSGAASSDVRAAADALRGSYAAQLGQLNLTEAQMQKYIELLGLTPEQVDTAIKVSGTEAARSKLNAYLQLLQGKIPPELATSVVASIEADDLQGAAAQLAAFARTNPVPLEVSPTLSSAATDKLRLELPKVFDAATAASGGYTDAQMAGLEAVQKLAEGNRSYLSSLVGSGQYARAQSEAERLNGEFQTTLEQLGLNTEQAAQYQELLGTTPDVVKTAIEIAGYDAAMFKIKTITDILNAENSGRQIPAAVQAQVGLLVGENNFEGAAALLDTLQKDFQDGVLNDPFILAITADTTPAKEEISKLPDWADGQTAAEVTVLADTAPVTAGVTGVKQWTENLDPSDIPIGANTAPAATGVQLFRSKTETDPPAQVKVGADTRPAAISVFGWFSTVDAATATVDVDANTDQAKASLSELFKDPFWRLLIPTTPSAPTTGALAGVPFGPPRASGGGLSPGYWHQVNEFGKEYVRSNAPLTVLNERQAYKADMYQPDMAPRGGGGSKIEVTYTKVKEYPDYEDLLRDSRRERVLAGGDPEEWP